MKPLSWFALKILMPQNSPQRPPKTLHATTFSDTSTPLKITLWIHSVGALFPSIQENDPHCQILNLNEIIKKPKPVFVYSCPMSSKVKERMLYSSSKAAVIAHAAEIGLDVEKNVRFFQISKTVILKPQIYSQFFPH